MAIAHRGSRFLWPENTMRAFTGAVDLGFSHLETDVRVTSDDVVVCIHDPSVDRTTNGTGMVVDHAYSELAALDAGYRHQADGYPYRDSGVVVPSLEDVVVTFPDVRLVVDLKEDGVVVPLVGLIGRLDLQDRLIVGSFSDQRLAEFHRLTEGNVPVSTGHNAVVSWLLAARVGRGVPGPARALQVPLQMRGVPVVTPRLVQLAHERGLDVHVWTVNDPNEMRMLLDIEVDGLVTDRPDLLRSVLEDRGQWRPV